MNFKNFLKLNEKHFVAMSSERISGRQERRTYIEKVLDELGFTFVVETDVDKTVPTEPEKPFPVGDQEPKVKEPEMVEPEMVEPEPEPESEPESEEDINIDIEPESKIDSSSKPRIKSEREQVYPYKSKYEETPKNKPVDRRISSFKDYYDYDDLDDIYGYGRYDSYAKSMNDPYSKSSSYNPYDKYRYTPSHRKEKKKFSYREFEDFCKAYYKKSPKEMNKKDAKAAFNDYYENLEYSYGYGHVDIDYPYVRSFYRTPVMKDNIAVFANGFHADRPTRILMAHYDVNTESNAHDNANDNGASVIVLLEYLEQKKFNDSKNIVVVFTDGEEFGGQGASSLGLKINSGIYGNVEWILNLDVVGIGSTLVFEDIKSNLRNKIEAMFKDEEVGFINMPPNDAMYIRSKGVDSICLSVIPDVYWDADKKKLKGRPHIWTFLHSPQDRWDDIQDDALALVLDAVERIMNT